MINPFIICNTAEQARYRQMTDTAVWMTACRALGAAPDAIAAYNGAAYVYARTTLYSNSDVVAYARQCALDALRRGEPMPSTPEAAIEREQAEGLRRALNL